MRLEIEIKDGNLEEVIRLLKQMPGVRISPKEEDEWFLDELRKREATEDTGAHTLEEIIEDFLNAKKENRL